MVKAIPTKQAVSRDTPRDPGPTMPSCCIVLRQCTRPVNTRTITCRPHQAARDREDDHEPAARERGRAEWSAGSFPGPERPLC